MLQRGMYVRGARVLVGPGLLALAGFWAAAVLAESSGLPLPTGTTVTTPVTTVEVPPPPTTVAPPTTALPVPPTTVSPPTVSTPVTTVSPPVPTVSTPAQVASVPAATTAEARQQATGTPAPAPAVPAPAAGTGSAPAPVVTGGAASPAAPTSLRPAGNPQRAQVSGVRARRHGARVATVLRIWLARPGRVRFVVRGPAPSCRAAAAFVVRGHRGGNTVRFLGRVHGRRLRPGLYALEPRVAGVAASGRPERILVAVSRRGAVPARRAPGRTAWTCNAGLRQTGLVEPAALTFAAAPPGRPGGFAWRGGVEAARSTGARQPPQLATVRRALPRVHGSSSQGTIVLLALLGLGLLFLAGSAVPAPSPSTPYGRKSARLISAPWRAVLLAAGLALLLMALTVFLVVELSALLSA